MASFQDVAGWVCTALAVLCAAGVAWLFHGNAPNHPVATLSGLVSWGLVAVVLIGLVVLLDVALASAAMLPVMVSLVTSIGLTTVSGRVPQAEWRWPAVVMMTCGACFGLVRVIERQRFAGTEDSPRVRVSTVIGLVTGSGVVAFVVLSLLPGSLSAESCVFGGTGVLFAGLAALFMIPPILEPLMRRTARWGDAKVGSFWHSVLALKRYRRLDAYPRVYAAVKLMIDPMFPGLADQVPDGSRVLDIGCGFGIPGVWLAVVRPNARITGLEPSASRVRIARLALGDRGTVFQGMAPNLPEGSFDVVLLLDVIYWLRDEDLRITLKKVVAGLAPGGKVVLRVLVPGGKRLFWRRVETLRGRLAGIPVSYRSRGELAAMLTGAGLRIEEISATPRNREEVWFIMGAAGLTGQAR